MCYMTHALRKFSFEVQMEYLLIFNSKVRLDITNLLFICRIYNYIKACDTFLHMSVCSIEILFDYSYIRGIIKQLNSQIRRLIFSYF